MHRILLAVTAMSIALSGAAAGTVTVRDGWVVIDTRQSFLTLVERLAPSAAGPHFSVKGGAPAPADEAQPQDVAPQEQGAEAAPKSEEQRTEDDIAQEQGPPSQSGR